ncbi:hypothetical protein BS614_04310 [Paenibacillus xylanexedens]|uniref:hypothetical protein n=1 Tax=Paenibacillus xylanexedens TaxID=528191 RepID=UPI00093851D6|nr:hypothetical protein [Paenibacillus xylanexedens]APO43354.1 hypothetical protein BS614_04310 [Paenibacillus xylanexedens]
MPTLDNFSLGNYTLGGPSGGVESLSLMPSLLNNASTWSAGTNGMGTVIASIPAGTRIISIAPLQDAARLTVTYTSGANPFIFIGLKDSKGNIWPLNNTYAGVGNINVSHSQLSIRTDESALAGWRLGAQNPVTTGSWSQSFVSKPSSFDPDSGPMELGLCISNNYAVTAAGIYMQYFRVATA